MRKKFVSIVLAALMAASLTTACGGKSETAATTAETTTAVETTKADTTKAEITAAETTVAESKEEPADNSGSEEFTLLDVTTDMIEAGVYAKSEEGTELVFSMFTEPSGTPMASLFVFSADGQGDVICGAYTADSETDDDGIAWTLLTGTDVYTGDEFRIGFGESGEEVYIFDAEGNPYEGQYLSEDDTINYMGAAAALMEAGGEAAANSASEDFTLLDVTTDMIEAGVYAASEDGTELVFSMFTEPSGTPMASLFIFLADGSGDVICGTYTAQSETDEDGIAWTLLTVSDVYTGNQIQIGFGELGEAVYILDSETAYEGKYLSKDETIVYMGTAAALIE